VVVLEVSLAVCSVAVILWPTELQIPFACWNNTCGECKRMGHCFYENEVSNEKCKGKGRLTLLLRNEDTPPLQERRSEDKGPTGYFSVL
jgi:hypothetical protein